MGQSTFRTSFGLVAIGAAFPETLAETTFGIESPPLEHKWPHEQRGESIVTFDCWTGGHTADLCCDVRLSPTGRAECWDGYYTFAKCCIGSILASGTLESSVDPSPFPQSSQQLVPPTTISTEPAVPSSVTPSTPPQSLPLVLPPEAPDPVVPPTSPSHTVTEKPIFFATPVGVAEDSEANTEQRGYLVGIESAAPSARVQADSAQTVNSQVQTFCWSHGYSAEWCCDVSITPVGRPECWVGPFTFAACCGDGVPSTTSKGGLPDCKAADWPRMYCCVAFQRNVEMSPDVASLCWGDGAVRPKKGSPREAECCSCEAMFFACEECVEIGQRDMITLNDIYACEAAGRAMFMELRWDGMQPYAACVPGGGWCSMQSLPRLIDKAEQRLGKVPRVDVHTTCATHWWLKVDAFVAVFVALAALFVTGSFPFPLRSGHTGGHFSSFDGKPDSGGITRSSPGVGSTSTDGCVAFVHTGRVRGSKCGGDNSCGGGSDTRFGTSASSSGGNCTSNIGDLVGSDNGTKLCGGGPAEAIRSSCGGEIQRPRNLQADLVRVICTAGVVALHLNVAYPNITPAGTSFFHSLNRLPRFVDGFTVLGAVFIADVDNWAVLVALDRLWRKMVRQWPVFLFPYHLFTGGWCTRITDCFPSDVTVVSSALPLPKRVVLRWAWRSGEADPWPYTVDLWIYLSLASLSVCQHHFGLHFYRIVFIAIIAYCWNVSVIHEAEYFGFSSYRLPMALFIFSLARCPRLFNWAASRPLLGRALVFGLLGGGFAPPVSDFSQDSSWKIPSHYRVGRYFVLSGLSFHLGLLWLVRCPELFPLPKRGSFKNCLRSLADLCFAVSLSHHNLLHAWRQCQQTTKASWMLLYYQRQPFFRSSTCHHERPAISQVLGGFVVVGGSLALSWAVVKFVQRPWITLASTVESRLRRALTAAFILLVLYDGLVQGIISANVGGK
eukprot:TRINITY_DN12549_c0_g3_i1.p1 TRINITY_DN12549_c0_g3~~TRINITY_DN12549_c0_g3_i1.p1  ORF type:complete len:950 (+),score=118.71 TRINITY_DN12549_c0_g3_i1:76-2925(+)